MDVRNKKVVVFGLGKTAVALARLLAREGARPFVSEMKDNPSFVPLCQELDALGVPYELGGHTDAAWTDVALVIPSPGVSPAIAPIRQAREAGADLVSEMEFASWYCQSRVLAVTGTNGKTTTTELLRALVEGCGHTVLLAGNNEFPFSAAVMASPPPEYIVLEVSSYQLENARAFRPWIAAVLNVTPDHLARHKTMENYAAVKSKIYRNQAAGDFAIINQDDPFVAAMGEIVGRTVTSPAPDGGLTVRPTAFYFSLEGPVPCGLRLDGDRIREDEIVVAKTTDTTLPGKHNLQNVLCALAMMRAGGFNWEKTLEGLRAFHAVEHRIEFVATIKGVEFYNDSKSTNIDSLKVAIESFERPIVLIAGGEGKGSDYRVLRDLVRAHVRHLVTIGQDAPKLEEAFGDLVPVSAASDMAEAVARAAAVAALGDVVLLSPACASFDMYENFEHRGRVFKECVKDYARRESGPVGRPVSAPSGAGGLTVRSTKGE